MEVWTLDWNGWPLERILILFVGLAFLLIFIQVTLLHYRQNFRHWAMWVPVIETPIFALLAFIYAFYNPDWFYYVLLVVFSVAILSGLAGTYYHIKGVGERVEGYKLRNFLTGPPPVLPILISAIGGLGLIALLWG
jgi:hypothetical protein